MAAPVTQETLDKIAQMIRSGMSDRKIADELGVNYVSISRWRHQGKLPEPYRPKTNNGKMREYEPLPKLQPGQRLDGTPIIKQEAKKVIEVEKAKVEEKAAEPASFRISRSFHLEGKYVRLNIDSANTVRIAMEYNWSQPMTAKEIAVVLMDLELDARALIEEVEKLL